MKKSYVILKETNFNRPGSRGKSHKCSYEERNQDKFHYEGHLYSQLPLFSSSLHKLQRLLRKKR